MLFFFKVTGEDGAVPTMTSFENKKSENSHSIVPKIVPPPFSLYAAAPHKEREAEEEACHYYPLMFANVSVSRWNALNSFKFVPIRKNTGHSYCLNTFSSILSSAAAALAHAVSCAGKEQAGSKGTFPR